MMFSKPVGFLSTHNTAIVCVASLGRTGKWHPTFCRRVSSISNDDLPCLAAGEENEPISYKISRQSQESSLAASSLRRTSWASRNHIGRRLSREHIHDVHLDQLADAICSDTHSTTLLALAPAAAGALTWLVQVH